jgi:acylphosphatase
MAGPAEPEGRKPRGKKPGAACAPAGCRAFRATVEGRVQGVGFRYSTLQEARRLGLKGWVRNEDDASVSLFAEGAPEALDRLAAWLEVGPPGAFVTKLRLTPANPSGAYADFDVAY